MNLTTDEVRDASAQGVATAVEGMKATATRVEKAAPKGSADVRGIVPAALMAVLALGIVVLDISSASAFRINPDDFKLFAAFYVVAQAIERLIEVGRGFLPSKSETGKANVALIASAAAVSLGVAASAGFGLYFLEAVSGGGPNQGSIPRQWDVLVSGLLIAGGTASLHELIARIQKAKEQAATGAAANSAQAAQTAANAAVTLSQAAYPGSD